MSESDSEIPEPPEGYRLYQDLAPWWPLISPPAEYAQEAAYLAAALESGDRPVRDLLTWAAAAGTSPCT